MIIMIDVKSERAGIGNVYTETSIENLFQMAPGDEGAYLALIPRVAAEEMVGNMKRSIGYHERLGELSVVYERGV